MKKTFMTMEMFTEKQKKALQEFIGSTPRGKATVIKTRKVKDGFGFGPCIRIKENNRHHGKKNWKF